MILETEPKRVMYYFNEISKIPRCSGNEKGISDYLYKTAKSMNLEVIQDALLNVIINKPASKGYEQAKKVIIQGHMDMVCEKDKLTTHDFKKDPIKLHMEGDYLYAQETTLGADNGMAIAMAMALLETDSHPALELIFTVDEEVNMTGADQIDTELITGDILINLDSEVEGVLTAGCAGGGRIIYKLLLEREENLAVDSLRIAVRGLMGGHSGLDIQLEKGNAIKILGRILNEIRDDIDLIYVDGGSMDNAIPREAEAIISTDKCKHVFEHIIEMNHILRHEFKVTDPGFEIQVTTAPTPKTCYSTKLKNQIIDAIILTPSGVLSRSTEIDLVICSNNLGVIKEKDMIELTLAPRSSVKSLLRAFVKQAERLGVILDFDVDAGGYYPGWTYDSSSKICQLASSVYEKMYGHKPKIEAIHAGLECGFFVQKQPSIDAISFGPSLYEVHTPHEHISMSSVKRTYDFLLELLKNIK